MSEVAAQVPHSDFASMSPSGALLEAQKQVLEMIVRARPLADVLDALCRIVESQATATVRASILMVDADGKRLWTGAAPSLPAAYTQATDGIAIAPDVGTCWAAAALSKTRVTRDIANDPGWCAFRHLPLGLGLKAAWSVPILSSSGAVLGTFGTYFLEEREPTTDERQLVEVLAHTAALAIERQRSDEALRASDRQHRFIAELAAVTQSLSEPAAVMATSARMLAEHIAADRCAYAEVEDERVFVITGDHPRGVPSIVGRWDVAAFGAACVSKMCAGEAYIINDSETDPQVSAQDIPAYRATNIRAVICVPLHKNGRFTAAMAVHQAAPRRWNSEEIALVSAVVASCWEALERMRVERTLRDSEARYRTMVEASPECVKLVAADGTLLQMNAAGLRMIEAFDEMSATGRNVYDLVAPECREKFREFNERVCQGESGTLQFDIVGFRGTRRSMETTAVPLPSALGGYSHLAVTRDITERAAADRALVESRARLDYAVRLSGVGFWYCDLPFDELMWDVRVKAHFFLPPHARVSIEDFYARLHPEDRTPTREAIESSIAQRTSYDVVYRTVDPDSAAIKWIRALGGATYAPDGSPAHFDGVTVEVTKQRRDQERLAQVIDREREYVRLLEKVAHAALTIHAASELESVLRVITTEARTIIGSHQAVTTLFATEGAQAMHSTSLSDAYRASNKIATLDTLSSSALASRSSWSVRANASTDANCAATDSTEGNGDADSNDAIAIPLVGRDGSAIGVVRLGDKHQGRFGQIDEFVLIQLAQIASVAIENARLYDQLREQDRRKDEFLATLAHELRNPLAPVRTGLQILRASTSLEQADKVRDMMDRQLTHLVRMVDDLLEISRVTLGKVTLKKERVDFSSLLHSALETTRPLIEAGRHQLVIDLPQCALPLDVDPTRLAQVLANLLNNAAKYTPSGGRIRLTAQIDAGLLVVRVSDTGVGIPAEMLPRVFDMFTQVGRSIDRSQGGLGVGLTLVRRLVEMHGGSVDAESAGVDLGSTFTVRVPLANVEDDVMPTADSQPSSVSDGALRVLVVDDNIDAAESLGMLLQLSGHEVSLTHTGEAALAVAATFKPDLVLLDIGLPGLNGYEVAQRLRADPQIGSSVVLIALTGWGTEEDRRQAHAAGFDRHLVKPVDFDKLTEVLSQPRNS